MNKVMVKINGNEYPMVGEKSEKHMLSVASYVDKEMTRVMEANPKLSASMAAILSAINIADIFFECSTENEDIIKENEELKRKVGNSDEELKIEMRNLQAALQSKDKEEQDYQAQIEDLNKVIEEQKKQIEELGNKVGSSNGEVESYKTQIEDLKEQLVVAEEKAEVAQKLSSKFQNDAYKIQLEKIELENEVKYLRAMK